MRVAVCKWCHADLDSSVAAPRIPGNNSITHPPFARKEEGRAKQEKPGGRVEYLFSSHHYQSLQVSLSLCSSGRNTDCHLVESRVRPCEYTSATQKASGADAPLLREAQQPSILKGVCTAAQSCAPFPVHVAHTKQTCTTNPDSVLAAVHKLHKTMTAPCHMPRCSSMTHLLKCQQKSSDRRHDNDPHKQKRDMLKPERYIHVHLHIVQQ